MTAHEGAPAGRARGAATLAASLVLVEFLAGMQRYLSQTVLPLVAAELDGAHLYGPLDAAAQAPMFLTMPLGAWLLSRYRVGRLMIGLTLVTVAGAVACALAPSTAVFLGGTAVRAAAAGALATVGMGAIGRGLPPRYRQLVLAAMSGVWVFSSVLGPVYAAGVASTLGWRWAMVLYLPLLLLARLLVARSMPERADEVPPEPAPWGWALVLATGSAVLSLPLGAWWVAAVLTGGALMLGAATRILPAGTLRARDGRRAALSALGVAAAVYFGASMVLSVVAHDGFGMDAGRYGFVIAAPGFCWAVAALWTGSHPAADDTRLRRRAVAAGTSITTGVAVLLLTTLAADGPGTALAGLLVGAGLLGTGMGTVYPDLLGRCLARPAADDGISDDRMASAVVVAESVGMALATTTAFAWLGGAGGDATDALHRARLLYVVLLPVAAVMVLRLVAATRRVPRSGTIGPRSGRADRVG